jgi:E3 ubiquitin-protein ligase RBX1
MNLALTLVYFLFATISTSSSQTLIFRFSTPRKPHRHLYFPKTPPFFIELHINLPSKNMTDIDMPDADSANLAEPSENMTNAELRPKASPVEPTTSPNEVTNNDIASFGALLADDITPAVWTHPTSVHPTKAPDNNEVDLPDVSSRPDPKAKTSLCHDLPSTNQAPNPKFFTQKFTGIATWAPGDGIYDRCAICRNHVLGLCIDCEISRPSDPGDTGPSMNGGCDIAEGLCRHVYHFHCISKWLGKHTTCPMDNGEWSFLRVNMDVHPELVGS